MRFELLIFAAMWRKQIREAVARAYVTSAAIRGLRRANSVTVFGFAKSVTSVLTGLMLTASMANAQNGVPAHHPDDDFSYMKPLTDKGYLLPSQSLFRVETAVATSAVPFRSPAIYKVSPELCGNACATQDNIPTAQESIKPVKSDDTGLGIMDYLSKKGEHDLDDETWNVYGQLTTIGFYKPSFHAAYTNLNGSNSSLKTDAETSFTQTLTLFFGLRLRPGTELYIVPEEISETTLSNLKGLGGATENFELQKVGALTPSAYRARLFVRQTIGLGGESTELPSGQMQLGEHVDSRRLVFTLGNFSALDVFDKNNVIGDLRRSFFDEAFMTYAAWDFPADARGYSIGAAAELYWDRWAVRLMRLMPPVEPNSQTLSFQPFKYYGDQVEFEHDHTFFGGQPGAVRLLLFRNHELMGRFADAISAFEANPADNAANCGSLYNYGSQNATAPDLCFVRKTDVKVGIGINAEQYITPNIGLFSRFMYADGQSEVEAYDSADRSANVGTLVKGTLWRQSLDSAGLGFGTSWISGIHAQYLKMGGVDGFIGDGALTQANENMTEIFYSRHISRSMFLSLDYQRVWNPGYNAVRGPVNLIGGKFHVEF